MKSRISTIRVSVQQLYDLFTQTTPQTFQLNPFVGNGSIQVFELEEGLLARVWDCTIKDGLEICHPPTTDTSPTHFSLLYLRDTKGLKLTGCSEWLPELKLRDRLLLGSGSDYKLSIVPNTRIQSLSISIAASWLEQALEGNLASKAWWEQTAATNNLFRADTRTAMESELLQEIFDSCVQNSLGTFGIKTLVLRMVTDFLHHSISDHSTLTAPCSANTLAKVETYLCRHITGSLPNLKKLSGMFSISESTLKRHFKKHYGITIAAYFTLKKMEYARTQIIRNGITLSEAAKRVGYRSIHKFTAMYRKYCQQVDSSPAVAAFVA